MGDLHIRPPLFQHQNAACHNGKWSGRPGFDSRQRQELIPSSERAQPGPQITIVGRKPVTQEVNPPKREVHHSPSPWAKLRTHELQLPTSTHTRTGQGLVKRRRRVTLITRPKGTDREWKLTCTRPESWS